MLVASYMLLYAQAVAKAMALAFSVGMYLRIAPSPNLYNASPAFLFVRCSCLLSNAMLHPLSGVMHDAA